MSSIARSKPVNQPGTDIIPVEQAGTLAGLFRERLRRSPDAPAYMRYDGDSPRWETLSWRYMAAAIARWQCALQQEALAPGDRVALIVRNCVEWVGFDLAALGLGLVTVPLYTNDRAENIGYILQQAGARLLLIEDQEQWRKIEEIADQLAGLTRIVTLEPVHPAIPQPRLVHRDEWLPDSPGEFIVRERGLDELATIVYTSGTTGRSKGVMLSHRNILWNAWTALKVIAVYPQDRFLSFLPLSHTLERTVGYYLPIMAGCAVAHARSIPLLGEDLLSVRPTILISVPRIFERVYNKVHVKLDADPPIARYLFAKAVDVGWRRFLFRQQRGRWSPAFLLWLFFDKLVAARIKEKLGGRLRFAVCGGAPLPLEVARLFIGLGVPIVQGYGLTETSPIISANSLEANIPDSVGMPMDGIEVRIGDHDELLTRSPSTMLGYWNDPEATARVIDSDGWLHTGDQVRMEAGHLFITGRLKEIIVLANGEKAPPEDMEMAIGLDGLFEQVLVVGEGKPFLTALVVLDADKYVELAEGLGLNPQDAQSRSHPVLKQALIERIGVLLHSFPGYARVVDVAVVDAPWTIENGLMTPTMKLRRSRILAQYASEIEGLYAGH